MICQRGGNNVAPSLFGCCRNRNLKKTDNAHVRPTRSQCAGYVYRLDMHLSFQGWLYFVQGKINEA